ncbi:hypothetical protein F5Y12DRAFT_439454 [Xylaria sp. FL1777]|nr:hypothetical protein F5Y12DRAFT_439454 [Xylaria sp. FL1777]
MVVHTDLSSSAKSVRGPMSGVRSEGEPATQLEGDPGSYLHPIVPRVEDFRDMPQGDRPDAGIKDLIEFLRGTPPPPTNYMSVPDNYSGSSEDDRWDKLKRRVFRYRRKGRMRRPPVIMLPDSAVSARTISGHRYIAISIPLKYSPLAPLPEARYPVYDSIETAFQREVGSMLGMWKRPPSNRLIPVLNPVVEDRESMTSSSPALTIPERPEQPTSLSSPSRARSQSNPLLPSQEQHHTLVKARELSKSRSVGSAHPVPQFSNPFAIAHSSEAKHSPMPSPGETGTPRPSSTDVLAETGPKDTDVAESSISRVVEKPVITLTLPPRRSSRKGKGPELTPLEKVISTSDDSPTTSNGRNNGSGMSSSGERARGSFAASIDTTGSSPRILKAQTATAYHPVPIVVTQPSPVDPESSLDLNSPGLPTGKGGIDYSAQSSPAGPPPQLIFSMEGPERRQKTLRERRKQDTEKLSTPTEHEGKGKGKEPVSQPFTPDMPARTPRRAVHHPEREDISSTHTSSSESSRAMSSASAHGRGVPSAQSFSRRKEGREERQARYIAKALAEERETLENLPREELIQRYEALREQRVYEREKRLRRLEHSRDTWIRAVPMLLQDLNGLLREQHRILEGARLMYAFPMPAGAPEQQQHHHHHQQQHRRRRSRSVEVSSSSLSSDHGVDPLDTRRSQSQSYPGHRSSR